MMMRRLAGDSCDRETCDSCGHVEYESPSILVACPLYEDDRLLWIRRATPPYKGSWAIPSGFVERGETVVGAACREVLEETGLQVDPEELRLLAVLSLPAMNQIYVAVTGPLPGHDYRPTAEASEIALFTREEACHIDLGYPETTFHMVMSGYDAIAAGASGHRPRLFVVEGHDPTA